MAGLYKQTAQRRPRGPARHARSTPRRGAHARSRGRRVRALLTRRSTRSRCRQVARRPAAAGGARARRGVEATPAVPGRALLGLEQRGGRPAHGLAARAQPEPAPASCWSRTTWIWSPWRPASMCCASARSSPAARSTTSRPTRACATPTSGCDRCCDVENLEAGYGGLPVLHGVTLGVDRNESVAIIGANGAGKSTLVRAICGLLPATAGRVLHDGRADQRRRRPTSAPGTGSPWSWRTAICSAS